MFKYVQVRSWLDKIIITFWTLNRQTKTFLRIYLNDISNMRNDSGIAKIKCCAITKS